MDKKVVVITGASSGIGLASAKRFAEAGYRVFGLSRRTIDQAPFEQIRADVTDDASVGDAIARVRTAAGRIDVLFNNAGFAIVGAAEESSLAQAHAIFETNYFGAVRVTNAVLPFFREQGYGRVLHTSSIVGRVPTPYMAHYAASKHALEAYSEALDHEVRTFGIRSVLIEPSFMKTALNAQLVAVDRPLAEYATVRGRVARVVDQGVAHSPEPSLVAEKVVEVAQMPEPGLRYLVGRDAKVLAAARAFAPAGVFGRALRAQFKLDRT